MRYRSAVISFAVGLSTMGLPASAHVGLEVTQAPAGAMFVAEFLVPHGCDGSPTTAIRVTLPAGVERVKPRAVDGWTLSVVSGPGAASPSRITWSGGSLVDAEFERFEVMMKLPETPGAMLSFPVLQTCEDGEANWAQAPGTASGPDALPVPMLHLGAVAAHHH